jgi:hypothetical protein
MEIKNVTRNNIIQIIQNLIDGTLGFPGRIEFYDNTGVQILATANLAPTSMVITNGVGLFIDIMPYLHAAVTYPGTANRWAIINHNDLTILTGTCGDQAHTDKDIVFNTVNLEWEVNDVIVIEELLLTIPAGNNDYIA